jgi:hypothetical protein
MLEKMSATAPFSVSRNILFYLHLEGIEAHGPQGLQNMRAFEDRLLSLAAQVAALEPGQMACGANQATDMMTNALEPLIVRDSALTSSDAHVTALQALQTAGEVAAADTLLDPPSENEELVRAYAHLLRACIHHAQSSEQAPMMAPRLWGEAVEALFQSPYANEQSRRLPAKRFSAARPAFHTLANPPLVPKKRLDGRRRWVAVAAL